MPANVRKTRTREHVIADMSVHHVGYLVVRCGYTFNVPDGDYGYDGFIITFDSDGRVENGNIFIQLKATDSLRKSRNGKSVKLRLYKRDISLWQNEPFPVYVVLYDAQTRKAYWLYLQRYLKKEGIKASTMSGKSVTIYLPQRNKVTLGAIRRWRKHKARVLKQQAGTLDHG
jgi:hypothetical protein